MHTSYWFVVFIGMKWEVHLPKALTSLERNACIEKRRYGKTAKLGCFSDSDVMPCATSSYDYTNEHNSTHISQMRKQVGHLSDKPRDRNGTEKTVRFRKPNGTPSSGRSKVRKIPEQASTESSAGEEHILS